MAQTDRRINYEIMNADIYQGAHFEENILIFLVSLRLDLLSELDHRFKVGIVFFLLD